MDELIGNVQTCEFKRKQGTTTKEGKKEKSIASRSFSKNELVEEEDEIDYITKRFQKINEETRRFLKEIIYQQNCDCKRSLP